LPNSIPPFNHKPQVAVIGGGPAGLMAAEIISTAGYKVALYDAMPSVGRKFLLAGVGGMNITHSESREKLVERYSKASAFLKPHLDTFSSNELCDWIHGLGIKTFVGSSGRVFPTDMKAAPLLRAWLHRLRELGVEFHPRHRWVGWTETGDLKFIEQKENFASIEIVRANAAVFALGGASWQRLGSNGAWANLFEEKNIQINHLLPSNCGFDINWSEKFQQEFAGAPLQTIRLTTVDVDSQEKSIRGEAAITKTGIEGTSIYALSASLRDAILKKGFAELRLDLLPDLTIEKILAQLNSPRGKNSASNFLRKQLKLPAVKVALLRELTPASVWSNNSQLANALKSLPMHLKAFRPIDEAISTAGGVKADEFTTSLMLKKIHGTFCAGEMLDWEAPTGGYLLTACFSTGRAAGFGVVKYLQGTPL
jgi:uncharacterized flavoprotein (TIGR03862 family)